MNKYGFVRVASCSPDVKIGDVEYNVEKILEDFNVLISEGCKICVFPELSVTGYSCGDLFRQTLLLEKTEKALERLAEATLYSDTLLIAGAPLRNFDRLYNCAVFIYGGHIIGVIPKTYLPNSNEFYEKRWFCSALNSVHEEIKICGKNYPFGTDILVQRKGVIIGAEICEDLWAPVPPSSAAVMNGADIIGNLSATNELIGKHDYLISIIRHQSAACRCGYVYASAGRGESSTDLVYTGNAIIAEDGSILAKSDRFSRGKRYAVADIDVEKLKSERRNSTSFLDSTACKNNYRIINIVDSEPDLSEDKEELRRFIDPMPFVPSDSDRLNAHCEEILEIQAAGLEQRLIATGCKNIVVGLSGGLDSTLALLVAHRAFRNLRLDLKGIHAITMPGFGTTDRTYQNALTLIERLGVSGKEISIVSAVSQHFLDIGHDIKVHDVTYENCQARERTQILMDYANKVNGMVLGTGDLSELALGWCTYNGDQMSMYAINASVPKTLVKYLVKRVALTEDDDALRICLEDIVDTPISPELIPANPDGTIEQKTEDLVGPYELHDFFLYHILRFAFSPEKIEYLATHAFRSKYDNEVIKHWLITFYKRFFAQQFKRSCMPDGPKVGSVCLSPRGDWRMPSDATVDLWLKSLKD